MKASEYLQHLMDKAGDNPNSLSRRSNVPQPTIFRFLSGTAKEPRFSTLEKLARAYNVPVEVFLKREARLLALQKESGSAKPELEYAGSPPKSTLIPVIGTAEMGCNGWYDDQEPGAEGFVSHFSDDKDAYALKVTGDSMFPAIRSGWFVVAEPNSTPQGGEYVSIHIKTESDEKKLVKEFLFKTETEVHLQSVNQSQRMTVPTVNIVSMHPIAAVVSPRKHKLIP